MDTTEALIKAAVHKFRAPRGEKFIHAGGRGMTVHTEGERILYLPDGSHVRIMQSDCNRTTHIEEDHSLHAIARPVPINPRLQRNLEPTRPVLLVPKGWNK